MLFNDYSTSFQIFSKIKVGNTAIPDLIFICFVFQQVINLIGPHLLPDEDGEYMARIEEHLDDFPVSTLDPNVFRSRSRGYKKSDENNWNNACESN